MNVADRLTRGRRALIAWVVVTVLLFGLFVVVRLNASSGLDAHIGAAQDRAVGHAAVIGGMVETKPGSPAPVFNRRILATEVQAEVFDDPTVARLRVYGPDGILLFATDQDVRPGDIHAPSEDPGVTSAAAGTPYRSIIDAEFTWSTVGAPAAPEELLQTFEPLRVVDRFAPVGVVEVDFFMDDLRAAAISERDTTLTVIAILALLSLAITVVTYRRTSIAGEAGPGPDVAAEENLKAAVASPRAKLKTAEGRREKAERSLEQVRAEFAAATTPPEPDPATVKELEELRRRLSEAETTARDAGAAAAASTVAHAPNGQEGAVAPSNEMLQRLEERMDTIAPLSDDASVLRARLAKTAARKRRGPSGDDG